MKLSSFLFVLSVQISSYCSSEYTIDYRLAAQTPRNCSEPGLFCETCSDLVVCIKNIDEDTWSKESVTSCEYPQRCIDGTCTNDITNPFCSGLADLTFPCRKPGIFPDPFYCDRYVLCVDAGTAWKSYLNNCEKGFGFNIESSLCDIKLNYGQCEEGVYPVPLCEKKGQSGSLPEQPSEYYVCQVYDEHYDFLYPVLNVCPGGQVYHNYECGYVTSTPVPSTTPYPTSPTTTSYPTSPTTTAYPTTPTTTPYPYPTTPYPYTTTSYPYTTTPYPTTTTWWGSTMLPTTPTPTKSCTKPGLFCETCSSLVACVQNNDDTWSKEHVETCNSPETCYAGTCVNNTVDPFCSGLADLTFPCRKTGIFPHPFYCNKFVLCVHPGTVKETVLKPYIIDCDDGFGFNITSSWCDIKLDEEQCEYGHYPVPLCERGGQSGPLPEKPAQYYICQNYNEEDDFIYPVLNVCPGGQVYANYQCT